MTGKDGRAAIIHADLDSFFASVEQRDDPSLRGRPVAVGGGIVVAASYEAKRSGVSTPMPIRRARALCPDIIEVKPRFEAYVAASRAVFEIFRDTTPLVQSVSIDEAFLDVSGLRHIDAPPVGIAARLRDRVRDEVGLPITAGVARTPFLAKVASRVAKPDGLLLVAPSSEDAFLHPLPVEMLWGVGPTTTAKLHQYGLRSAGDVAARERAVLVSILGRAAGNHLHAVVHGHTPTTVVVGRRRGSVGAQRAIGRGPHRWEDIEAALLGLVDRVSRRLRGGDRAGSTVELRLRFDDYTKASRSRSLRHPTGATAELAAVALSLLASERGRIAERGITLVGVAVANLADAASAQPELPLGRDERPLDAALDDLAGRFGTGTILRGSLVRRGEGWAALQPD